MTDRINAFTVVLDESIRVDDVEPLVTAISQLRGVQQVLPVVASSSDFIAEARERVRLIQRLQEFLSAELMQRAE